MEKVNQLKPIVVHAISDTTPEEFIINDIEMGIAPSDIQVMDDSYVYEQSFVRSNSVYCFKSKYSETKMVLNFPFQIGKFALEDDNTEKCLRLVTQLNSYPFCFIKSTRVKTYISPQVLSSTGYMIFAVDEIALIQSAAASNMMFLEVTLRYFNHAPLASDFKFVDLNSVGSSDTVAISEDQFLKFEREMLQDLYTQVVGSLSESVVWGDYMNPKITKMYKKLRDAKVLEQFQSDDSSIHPGLDVKFLLPLVLTSGSNGQKFMNNDDGTFVGYGSKMVTTTDLDAMDDLDLPDMLLKTINQDFSEEAQDDSYKSDADRLDELNKNRARLGQGPIDPESPASKKKEAGDAKARSLNAVDSGDTAPTIKSGAKELFIQYSGVAASSLNMAVQRIEVRRKNQVASQKIGAYKHPILQYMGKMPAIINVQFAGQSDGIYNQEESSGLYSFITTAMQVLDENRRFHPEAEAYNVVKVLSLASLLLDAESCVPGQNIVSASAESAGVEAIALSFRENNVENFIAELDVESSGARAVTKAKEELYDIVLAWLKNFSSSITYSSNASGGTALFSKISSDESKVNESLKIFESIFKVGAAAAWEMGYKGAEDELVFNLMLGLSNDNQISTENQNKTVSVTHLSKNSFGSGIHPLYCSQFNKSVSISEQDQKELNEKKAEEDKNKNILEKVGSALMEAAFLSEGIDRNSKEAIERQKAYDILKDNVTTNRKVAIASLSLWFSQYLAILIGARADLARTQTTKKVSKFALSSNGQFDAAIANTAALINATFDTNPISSSGLTQVQKNFLNNYADNYLGSLFGQNLTDLTLQDLATNYDRTKDVVIQNTNPFFFLRTEILMGDEMFEYYNNAYDEEKIDPGTISNEDAKIEPKITQIDQFMGIDLSKRVLREVDFNADSFNYGFPAYDRENPGVDVMTAFGQTKTTENVIDAIEQALAKYGMSNDNDFRIYMYKTAYIESGYGANLKATSSSAKGLFQYLSPAVQEIMKHNNRVFAGYGWVKLSPTVAKQKADQLVSDPRFQSNHQLSAEMFIESYLLSGGKKVNPKTRTFDMPLTFAYHNIGAGSANYVSEYLSTGSNPNTPEDILKLIRNNGASSPADWYNKKSTQYKNAPLPQGVSASGKQTLDTAIKGVAGTAQQSTADTKKSINLKGTQSTGRESADIISKQTTSVISQQEAAKNKQSPGTQTITAGQKFTGTVKYIVDGDTFDVLYNDSTIRVRLAYADTKETTAAGDYKSNGKFDRDWGYEAKGVTTNLIYGKQVTITMVDIDSFQKADGAQQRIVARVTTADGKDLSGVLIGKGLANLKETYNRDPRLSEIQKKAQKEKAGFWSQITPEELKQALATMKAKGVTTASQQINAVGFPSDSEILRGATDSSIKYNTYQPFQDGKNRVIKSEFTYGSSRKDIKRASPHEGIDLQCNVGTTIVASAGGIATIKLQSNGYKGYGQYIDIDHQNGFSTRYAHLSKVLIKSGQKVAYNQPIGLSGGAVKQFGSGSSTGPHLHYEVRFKGKAIHPYSTRYPLYRYTTGVVYQGEGGLNPYIDNGVSPAFINTDYKDRVGITAYNTVYNENELATAIMKNAISDINIGLSAAVPAIKVYVVIGNENDGVGLDTLTTGSQYYELRGVQSFKVVCNNDKSPVDTAIMTVIDPSFGNTDAWTNYNKNPEIQYDKIGTDFETQWKMNRLLLRPGTKLQVRLGYGNDPNKLHIVFNGGIMEVGNENGTNQMLTLLLEGYGRELLQEIKSPQIPEKLDGDHHSPTTVVLGKSLLSKPIDHFGFMQTHLKWLYKDENDPEARNMVQGFWNSGSFAWFNTTMAMHRSRLYMNIFAPEIESVDDEFAGYWSSMLGAATNMNHQFGYPFYVYRMTPWDCCKQMEYRHPGTIFKPMMFEDRMTVFYGVKEQMYFARDLSKYTQAEVAKRLTNRKPDDVTDKYFSRRRERMEPVSNIHMISSSTNLISNQMKLNGQWSTVTNVAYFDDNDKFNKSWEWDFTRMELDDNLLPWEIREKTLQMSGVHGAYPSFLYGTTDLKKEAETMYDGTLLIRGNGRIKAGDYAFIDDMENRLSGLVLVRDCIHHFDPVNGFVTEITPGLYVEPARFMYTSLWLQLLCAYKVGASKIRMSTSTNYSAEYYMVTEYLKILNQLDVTQTNLGSSELGYMPYVGYYGAAGLNFWLTWSLAKSFGLKKYVPFANITKFSATVVQSMMGRSQAELAKKVVEATRAGQWVQKGASFASSTYKTQKARLIGSPAYRSAVAAIKGKSAYRTISRSMMVRVPKFIIGKTAPKLLGFSMRSAFALAHGLAATNPVGILLDIALSVVFSWAAAQIEKTEVTRQPLFLFPVIKHGKQYQAGMTGSVRNSYVDGLKTEYKKTLNQISKAAAVLEGNQMAQGKKESVILSLLGKSALEGQRAKNEDKYVMTRSGAQGIYRLSENDKKIQADNKEKEQKKTLAEATK